MPHRHLPVRPNLTQLKHQAKDLLRSFRRGDPEATADFVQFHPRPVDPVAAKLADAQLVLARSYQAASWPRLVQSCDLIDAIWRDDLGQVVALVQAHPNLLHENAGVRNNNWGPPMSYAANLGRDAIIEALLGLGAKDAAFAMDRAALQGKVGTARLLHAKMGKPTPPPDSLGGPAYTLNVSGTALLLELGAQVRDQSRHITAPVAVVLETDSRNPPAKHRILEMYVEHGVELPDTPMMAMHRGRIDLLEAHARRDPDLFRRTFRQEEIFPPEFRCQGDYYPRTSLDGATLLHACVEFDELELATWLLEHGMAVDTPAAADHAGFGGHTALFSAVVCYANFWGNYRGGSTDSPFARLLLQHGANPNARASLRETIRDGKLKTIRELRDITPIGWGEQFGYKLVVSEPAIRLIAERGGHG